MNGRVSYLLIFLLALNPSNLPAKETPFYFILGPGEFPKVNNSIPKGKEYIKGKIPYADWLIERRGLVRDDFVQCVADLKKIDSLNKDKTRAEFNWILLKSKKKLDYIKFLEEKFLSVTGITMEQAGYNYGVSSLKEEISILEKAESEQKSRGSNDKTREKNIAALAVAPVKKDDIKKAKKVVEEKSEVTPGSISETVEIDREKPSDSLKKEGFAEKVSSSISRLKTFLIEKLTYFRGNSNDDKSISSIKGFESASLENKGEPSINQEIKPVKNTVSGKQDEIFSLKEEREKLKLELEKAEDQKKKKESELKKTKAILAKSQHSNRACREKNEKIAKSLKKLEKELSLKEEKITALSNKLFSLEKELTKNKEELNSNEDSKTEVDLIFPPTAPEIGIFLNDNVPEKKISIPEYKSFYDEEIKLSNERINQEKNELKKSEKKETVSELSNKNDKEQAVSLKENFMNEISEKVEKEKIIEPEKNYLDTKNVVDTKASSESEKRTTDEAKKEESDKKDEKMLDKGSSLEQDKKKETLFSELSEKLSVENTDNLVEAVEEKSISDNKQNSKQKEKEKTESYFEGESSELDGRISGLKDDISQKESKIKELSEKLDELSKSNNRLGVQKDKINNEIDELNALILKKKEEVSVLSKQDGIEELAPKAEKESKEPDEEQEQSETKKELESSLVSKLKESLASEDKEQEAEGAEDQENEESSVETKKGLNAEKSSVKREKISGLTDQLGEVDEGRKSPVILDSDEKVTKLKIKESAKQNDSEKRINPRILEEGLIEESNGPTF